MPSGTLTTVEVDDRQPFVAPAETTATIRSLARSRTRVARNSAVRRYAAWSVNTDPPILTTVNTERSTLDVHCEGARVLRSGSLMPDARSFAFGRLEHRNCPNITRRCTTQRVEGRSQTAARARIGVQPSPIAAVTGGRRRGPAAPDAVARQQLGDVNGIRETNRRSQPHEPAAAARWLRVAALRRSRVASLAAFGKGFCNVIEERRGCRVRARARTAEEERADERPAEADAVRNALQACERMPCKHQGWTDEDGRCRSLGPVRARKRLDRPTEGSRLAEILGGDRFDVRGGSR
jgi:hypothetical protein